MNAPTPLIPKFPTTWREAHALGIVVLDEDEYTEQVLNEVYEPLTVCGYSWEAGTALRKLDHVAFNQEVLNHMSAQCDENIFKELNDGSYIAMDDWLECERIAADNAKDGV